LLVIGGGVGVGDGIGEGETVGVGLDATGAAALVVVELPQADNSILSVENVKQNKRLKRDGKFISFSMNLWKV
jgi:hypothetical protein